MFFHRPKQHNLLAAKKLFRPPPRPAPRWLKPAKRTGFVAALAVAVLAVLTVPFLLVGILVYTHADRGRDALGAAVEQAKLLDLEEAMVQAETAAEEFAVAQAELAKLAAFRLLPYVRTRMEAADRLLATGSVTIAALQELLAVMRDVAATAGESADIARALDGSFPDALKLFRDLEPEEKRAILAGFSRNAPRISSALDKIDAALASLEELSKNEAIRPLHDILGPLQARLVRVRDTLSALLPAAETLPSILGFPDEKHYLIFLQNDTELRPTGGFLGVYALALVKDAGLVSLASDDVYALDGPSETEKRLPAPPPFTKYVGVKQWYLRDANWSPDFPTSAALMEQFFLEEAQVAKPEQAVPIDGIIAVSTKPATDLLRLLGPITIDGVTFTADNLVDELEFQVEQDFANKGIPRERRKDIVGRLMREIFSRLTGLTVGELLAVAGLVHQNLDEGHILFAMKDSALQRSILEHDWGGQLLPVRGDYLAVIDANLAALKSDPAVRRSIAYTITPEGRDYLARVAITYEHRGQFDWKTTRYRTYTRVYAPAGSILVGSSGAMENDKLKDPRRRPGKVDVYSELDRTAFGAFIAIEPGERRTLEFAYRLPPAVGELIRSGAYRLDVEKQSGTISHGLTLDLDFDKTLKAADPPEPSAEWGDERYRYSTDLRTDRRFDIRF